MYSDLLPVLGELEGLCEGVEGPGEVDCCWSWLEGGCEGVLDLDWFEAEGVGNLDA